MFHSEKLWTGSMWTSFTIQGFYNRYNFPAIINQKVINPFSMLIILFCLWRRCDFVATMCHQSHLPPSILFVMCAKNSLFLGSCYNMQEMPMIYIVAQFL